MCVSCVAEAPSNVGISRESRTQHKEHKAKHRMSCLGDCLELGPPPDMILSMPPPPLSSFLLPKNALAASKPNGNSNNSLLCSAAFICEPSLKANEQSGMEFVELPGNGRPRLEKELKGHV